MVRPALSVPPRDLDGTADRAAPARARAARPRQLVARPQRPVQHRLGPRARRVAVALGGARTVRRVTAPAAPAPPRAAAVGPITCGCNPVKSQQRGLPELTPAHQGRAGKPHDLPRRGRAVQRSGQHDERPDPPHSVPRGSLALLRESELLGKKSERERHPERHHNVPRGLHDDAHGLGGRVDPTHEGTADARVDDRDEGDDHDHRGRGRRERRRHPPRGLKRVLGRAAET